MDSYRYADNPPVGLLSSVIIQAVIIALINFTFLVVLLKGAHLTPALVVAHQQWLMVAFFFTNVIQCLRFSRIGAGLFIPATSPAIYLAPGLIAIAMGGLPLMIGMMMFAAFFELAFSFFVRRLRRLLPPEIHGLAFMIIGIQLCTVAFSLSISSFPSLSRVCFLFVILGVILFFCVWSKGVVKNLCPLYGIFLGVILFYFFPSFFHYAWRPFSLSDFSWTGYPPTSSFWPIDITFKWGLVPLFALTAFVATIRTIGVTIISNKYESSSEKPNYSLLRRAIRGDAISSIFSSFTCGLGVNVAPITTTLTVAAKCTSRYIAIVVAVLFLVLSFSPKVLAFLSLVPYPLIGVILMWYGVMLIGSGLRTMNSKEFDIQEVFSVGFGIIGVITVLVYPGIYAMAPYYLGEIIKQPLTSGLVLAIILTILFNVRRKKDIFRFKDNPEKPEGMHEFASKILAKIEIGEDQKHHIIGCLQEAMEKLHSRYTESDVTVAVARDKINLDVTLSYRGELLEMRKILKNKFFSLFDEQVVSAGLAQYFNIMPDNFSQIKKDDICTLKFGFYLV